MVARTLTILAAVGLLGCGDGDVAGLEAGAPNVDLMTGATLSLQVVESTSTAVVVDVIFAPRPDAERPRVMELHLEASDALTFTAAAPLEALEQAGKDLIARPAGRVVRLVSFSAANLNRVEAGPLMRLWFERAEGQAKIAILDRMPIFAPAAANSAIRLPDAPLVVEER